MNYILLAVPGFFILIAIELLANHLKKTDYYRFNDAINSISMGMLSRISGVLYALIPLSIYNYFYDSIALIEWQMTIWTWILVFVLYDLSYYWNHRIGHMINIGWASHVVHHSSEEYNLSTALRQTSIPNPLGALCYLPIAFLGFPPWVLLTVGSFNLLYQFWVHTQLINRMPNWFEAIFVTPSNHRVHHAKNKIYVDKNFGGVFILWDRLFKTYQAELAEEKVVFGISTQLASWNPLWGNVKVLKQLISDAWHAKSWLDKFTIWFRKTGYRPADVEANFPIIKSNQAVDKYDTPLNSSQKGYIIVQYLLISAGIISFMMFAKDLQTLDVMMASITLIFALLSLSKLQENHKQVFSYEGIKFSLCICSSALFFGITHSITLSIILVSAVSLLTIILLQRQNSLQIAQ